VVFTDGSHEKNMGAYGYIVNPSNEQLNMVPFNENEFKIKNIINNNNIRVLYNHMSESSFQNELDAILLVITQLPFNSNIHIYTDSLSSITVINNMMSYPHKYNVPKLNYGYTIWLIYHIIKIKNIYNFNVKLSHVKSHSESMDYNSLGNKLIDGILNQYKIAAQWDIFDEQLLIPTPKSSKSQNIQDCIPIQTSYLLLLQMHKSDVKY